MDSDIPFAATTDIVNLQRAGRNVGGCATFAQNARWLKAMTLLGEAYNTSRVTDDTYRMYWALYNCINQDDDYAITLLACDTESLRKAVYETTTRSMTCYGKRMRRGLRQSWCTSSEKCITYQA